MPKIIHTLRGKIGWFISRGDEVVSSSQYKFSNLILNQGLDYISLFAFADCFNYCALGNGSVPPIKTDVGLTNELIRFGTLSPTPDSHGASLNGNVYTLIRTFRSGPALAEVSYSEVGFSPYASVGNNLFSKALIKNSDGQPITVVIQEGLSINIRYEFSIEINDAERHISRGIYGKSNSSGVSRFQKVGLKGIDLDGITNDFDDTNGCNEPSLQSSMFMSLEGAPPDVLGQCVDRSLGSFTMSGALSLYVNGEYMRKKSSLVKPSVLPSSWRSLGVGSPTTHGAIFVFNEVQNSEPNKAYLVSFTYIWTKENTSNFLPWLDYEDAVYNFNRFYRNNSHSYLAL